MKCLIVISGTMNKEIVKTGSGLWKVTNYMPLLPAPLSSERYLLARRLSVSAVFSSRHGDQHDWLSRRSRKCCEDNRMCPGSAVEGRRIQGSYCTLWNGPRNARCLPFFFLFCFVLLFFFSLGSKLYHMLDATGFEDNVTPVWYMSDTVTGTRMFAVAHLHIQQFLRRWTRPRLVKSAKSLEKPATWGKHTTNAEPTTPLECGYQHSSDAFREPTESD